MGAPDLAAILRMLETTRATGTLGLSAGEIDVDGGRVAGAWAGDRTGREALEVLRSAETPVFSFTSRRARPANVAPEPERGVRASLSMIAGRTIPRLDLVSREQLLRRGLFTTKQPTLLDEPAAAANVWKPGPLADLANALITEYARQTYGGQLWNDDIATRFAAAGPMPSEPLRVDRGRIDAAAAASRADLDQTVPFLRALVRAIYGEAMRGPGEGAARRGYRAAVARLWGAHERVLAAAMRMVEERPPAPARLVATKALDRTARVVDREYVVGRAASADIQLAHPSVSRRHALVSTRAGAHVVSDAGSTSGALVNGAKIEGERALRDGDLVTLGDVELRYERD